MFARLQSEQIPTPVKSDSPTRSKSFKRRLQFDDDEDEGVFTRPPSPKKHRQTHYSAAPLFNKHKILNVDEDDHVGSHVYNRRQPPSPPTDPDPPLVKQLDENYANLRATIHSAALSGLEEAEKELVARSDADINANRQKLAGLETQINKLVGPLQDLTVDYTATGEDGRERTVAVAMRDAIAAFEAKLQTAIAELERLWDS
ncbi:hypothetical protein F5Y04DRAFT_288611 [Hypomontagnella monticulosa]|nr:hypothetical protein F5Y04DRAFT_288611 [Hypomontagnella monticulosa]